jgi:hypothetical protein
MKAAGGTVPGTTIARASVRRQSLDRGIEEEPSGAAWRRVVALLGVLEPILKRLLNYLIGCSA